MKCRINSPAWPLLPANCMTFQGHAQQDLEIMDIKHKLCLWISALRQIFFQRMNINVSLKECDDISREAERMWYLQGLCLIACT